MIKNLMDPNGIMNPYKLIPEQWFKVVCYITLIKCRKTKRAPRKAQVLRASSWTRKSTTNEIRRIAGKKYPHQLHSHPVPDLDLTLRGLGLKKVKSISTNKNTKKNVAEAGNTTLTTDLGTRTTEDIATKEITETEEIADTTTRIGTTINRKNKNLVPMRYPCRYLSRLLCLRFPGRGESENVPSLLFTTTDVIKIITTANFGIPSHGFRAWTSCQQSPPAP